MKRNVLDPIADINIESDMLLDLGDVRRVVCVKPGPFDDCEIEVVGTRGSCRFSTNCILSRNRFEGEKPGVLWNVRTQYLLAHWQEMHCRGDKKPEYAADEKIKLPSTRVAMEWVKKTARGGLTVSRICPLTTLQGEFVKWVSVDGELVSEPEWFRPMYALCVLYSYQNAYKKPHKGCGDFDRMFDEYVVIKLVLDAYAGKLKDGAIDGETFECMIGACDNLREMISEFNRQVDNGTVLSNRDSWAARMEEVESGLGYYNYRHVHCDFDDAMRECVNNCRRELLSATPKRVEKIQRYTPFRYPGTQVAFNIW